MNSQTLKRIDLEACRILSSLEQAPGSLVHDDDRTACFVRQSAHSSGCSADSRSLSHNRSARLFCCSDCRQLGNLQGREKRELADDHPLKVIYNRRMNTIQVYLRRGTLDEATAEKMKRLARNKLERAISDAAYANVSYAEEMEQDALLTEATS